MPHLSCIQIGAGCLQNYVNCFQEFLFRYFRMLSHIHCSVSLELNSGLFSSLVQVEQTNLPNEVVSSFNYDLTQLREMNRTSCVSVCVQLFSVDVTV